MARPVVQLRLVDGKGRPRVEWPVMQIPDDDDPLPIQRTDDQGVIVLFGVPDAGVRVRVFDPALPGDGVQLPRLSLRCMPDAQLRTIVLDDEDLARLHGSLIDDRGVPVDAALIVSTPDDPASSCAAGKIAAGRIELPRLPPEPMSCGRARPPATACSGPVKSPPRPISIWARSRCIDPTATGGLRCA